MARGSAWVADFETTTEADFVVDGYVRVFLWHARAVYTDDERIGYDVESFVDFAREASEIWFHNLKFDGSYILDHILKEGWTRSVKQVKKQKTFDIIVTDQGQWMQLTLMYGNHVTRIKDSAKKFPGFSLEKIAKLYKIEGKSDLYLGYRGPNYVVTEEDIERVRGDTRILKVAILDLHSRGMKSLTMAGDAMNDYKEIIGMKQFDRWFPKLTLETDHFIRQAYRGGWTYVNPLWQGKTVEDVDVYDVNSMYPSRQRDCLLPYGMPYKHRGEPREGELYIVRFSCSFKVKEGKFPMIQRKGSFLSIQAEYVYESDGLETLYLTSVDYELFHECYDVYNETGHEYLYFRARHGMFDTYIDKWVAEKIRCTKEGDKAGRDTAKRFLNSLYGKFGTNPIRKRKLPELEDDRVRWVTVDDQCDGAYAPIAVFVCSYAHRKILDMANAFGDDFIYADTDSVHVIHRDTVPEGLDVDDNRLGAWKLESHCDKAKYLRAKTYIHATKDNELEDVKIAGCPEKCKMNVTWDNFALGAKYEGKLMGKTVPGGYCLIETTFKITVGKGGIQHGE